LSIGIEDLKRNLALPQLVENLYRVYTVVTDVTVTKEYIHIVVKIANAILAAQEPVFAHNNYVDRFMVVGNLDDLRYITTGVRRSYEHFEGLPIGLAIINVRVVVRHGLNYPLGRVRNGASHRSLNTIIIASPPLVYDNSVIRVTKLRPLV